jgi:hypothetical protein
MDSKRLEELLQKYWNCESSLEEEEALRTYFATHDDVPEALKDTADLFRYFGEHKEKTLNDAAFDARIAQRVKTPTGRVRSLVYNTMRIAAGVAALVSAVWFMHRELSGPAESSATAVKGHELEDTYDDPKLAFEETKKALMMISKSFGKAEEQARKINLFNEAKEEIEEQDTQATQKF